jgi:predicted nucleotidyltransferase
MMGMGAAMDKRLHTALIELRCRFETLYGERLVRMVLFGSQARGDAEPGSDIDVLVVLKGPVEPYEEIKRSSDIVGELSLDWDVVISCVFMDENQFFQRDGPFLRNVRREGVAV